MSFVTDRRNLLVGTALTAAALAAPGRVLARTAANIVIIGGGFGGASAAKALAAMLPSANITLVEANPTYVSCPFSNLVLGTDRSLSEQAFGYDALRSAGIRVVHALAMDIDAATKQVTLESAETLTYDRLILSPGIDIRWGALEGYDEAAAQVLPHAWKAGPQTTLLRQQLEALEDGQTVLMSVPRAPYRCPPGPYERASMIAHFLKARKPNSKLVILDAKDQFSKQALFEEAWAEHYPEHLEWRGAASDGAIARVDAARMEVYSDFETFTGGVINVIPPQKAGWIAERAGTTDATGWCPIDPLSFESRLQPSIHVIGDATIAAPMPKSAFSANLQAKVCALAIARILSGLTPQPTVLSNTCYSYTTPDQAISIAGVYHNSNDALSSVAGAGGISPLGAVTTVRQDEARQAEHWFNTITDEAFG